MTAKNETSCKTCALQGSCGLKTHRKQYCMCHTLVAPTMNPENSTNIPTDLITVSRSKLEKVLEAVECERIYELYSQCPDDFWTHDKCVGCLLNFIKGDAND